MHQELIELATQNISDMLRNCFNLDQGNGQALILFDTENELSKILTESYRSNLPQAHFVDFNTVSKEEILNYFEALNPGDLVVMIQTTNFRLNDFRIRINLFNRKLQVIEHMRLYRNTPDMWETYVKSLAHDKDWYQHKGKELNNKLSETQTLQYISENHTLTVNSELEVPKLNIGDYSAMKNIGGSFPIGEVFTEAKDLTKTNGTVSIYAFADQTFKLHFYDPFTIDIKEGEVVGWGENTPQTFIDVVNHIKEIEKPMIRELGFGLNKAITRETPLGDITAFERNLGLHFSMGEKHSIYAKDGISKSKARFHVDLYLNVDEVKTDTKTIYKNREYIL